MRPNIIYSLLAIFTLFSCQNTNLKTLKEQPQELATMKRFAASKIGTGDGNSFDLTVTETSLLKVSSDFIKSSNEGALVSYTYKIETIDSKKFLRLYRKDGKITTVELVYKPDEASYYTGNTVCTSSSKENGCIPNGLYCTKIENDLSNSCTKTSFGFYD